MKAYLHSVRIAPKKANLIAMLVRGQRVEEAISALRRTNKKGARIIEKLLKSAVANAEHNEKQNAANLVIRTIVVNQGTAYHRGIPMARGRVRPIRKFMSHIEITLGVAEVADEKTSKKPAKTAKKSVKAASSKEETPVESSGTHKKSESGKKSSDSSESSVSSAS